MRTLLIIFILIRAGFTWAQTAAEARALRDLTRQRWDKCSDRLTKILSKDSVSVGGHYVKALYFFSSANPHHNLDSASFHLNKSMFFYESLLLKERLQLSRLPLDSVKFRSLRQSIDSTAYVRAKDLDTEEGYTYFLQHFPSSLNYGDAMLFLHDAAFRNAKAEGTYEAFDRYLTRYPESRHKAEARAQYDRLLFETHTRDKRLSTFRQYVVENPRSPYRHLAEQQIMEISTASGDPASFEKFIREYPGGSSAHKALSILYHILRESDADKILERSWNDSIMNVHRLNQGYLVPFLSAGRFGFMNVRGEELIPALADSIDDQYLCGNIIEDVIVVNDKLLGRNGQQVFHGNIDELDDPGYGFLTITTNDKKKTVLHKSGFHVLHDSLIEEVRIPHGRLMAIKINNAWRLYTLTGRLLLDVAFDDVKNINQVLALKKSGQWYLLTYEQAGLIADQQPASFLNGYDEIKAWPLQLIWVKRGDQEGLLNENLEFRIPCEKYELKPLRHAIEIHSSQGRRLLDWHFVDYGIFDEIKSGSKWLGVRTEGAWKFFDPSQKQFLDSTFDSLFLMGSFPVGVNGDSTRVYFDNKNSRGFYKVSLSQRSGKDSTYFLLVTGGKEKTLYNREGNKMFSFSYDELHVAGQGVFSVSRKEKKGLVNEAGKTLLPVTYDAIGETDGIYIPLLRSMRFGLYNLVTKKEIRPQFDKNLKPYSHNLFVGFKDGYYGMVDNSGKTIMSFEFDDIVHWNDTAALVKKNALWQLVDVTRKKVILDQLRTFKFIAELKEEKTMIVQQNNSYGVLNNVKGVILQPTYTDIINIGSAEEPLYFTEKHVEEANIFIVIYYDKSGKLIRRQAFEPEEYEMIYCSTN